jgi:hypothetical protein
MEQNNTLQNIVLGGLSYRKSNIQKFGKIF